MIRLNSSTTINLQYILLVNGHVSKFKSNKLYHYKSSHLSTSTVLKLRTIIKYVGKIHNNRDRDEVQGTKFRAQINLKRFQ